MTLSILALLLAAPAAAPLLRTLAPRAAWLLPLPMLMAAAVLTGHLPGVISGEAVTESLPWVVDVAGLDIDLSLRLDGLGWLFAMLAMLIGALVMVHAVGYFRNEPGLLGRFAGLTLLFAASMLGLVLADDLFVLFVFWELTSLCSFLLIGLQHEKDDARSGALRALLVTGAGGLALLLGLVLLASAAGTSSVSELVTRGEAVRASPLYLPALLLILGGAFTKSAQVPFHYWLPGAMAAPAPVSAYLHSATLVKAGVYLLLRLHPALGVRPEWHLILGHVGAITMILGAVMAFGQRDLKRLLAYTTIAGLGTAVMLLGIGTTAALRAAILFVAVHALYKAALFMVVAVLDKRTGLRDVDQLRGLARAMPVVFLTAGVAALSMAGLPPLLGALSKELVYEAKLGAPEAPWLLAAVGATAGALKVGCALMVGVRPFLARGPATSVRPGTRSAWLMAPPAVLALLSLVLGAEHERTMAPVVDAALAAVGAEPATPQLLADASPATVSWLSKGTLAAGLLLFLARPRLVGLPAKLRSITAWGPAAGHQALDRGLQSIAKWVAATSLKVLQPRLLALVAVGLAAVGLRSLLPAGVPAWPGSAALPPHEAALVALVAGGALFAAATRSPQSAVVALGVLGVGLGLLFLVLGGPDLALTQVAVDALAVLLLLLVLRRAGEMAPPGSPAAHTPPAPASRRVFKAAAALTVGLLFTLFTWAAVPDGALRPVSRALADLSWPRAHGRNVVNVILVDVRALDTLGEIVVLTAAALGVLALLRAGRTEAQT